MKKRKMYFHWKRLMNLTTALVVLVLFQSNISRSQDYTEYYRLCNDADSLIYLGEDQYALETFQRAFKTVEYPLLRELQDAYKLAINLSEFDAAENYGKSLLLGTGKGTIIKTESETFKASQQYRRLLDSSEIYLKEYENRINWEYVAIIDSLYYIDQRIVRKNKSIKGNYNIDKKSLPKDLFELDQGLWLHLSTLIDSLGFPSVRNVSAEASYRASLIIHHNLREEQNASYHPRIFGYLKSGEYSLLNFTVWYEQYQTEVLGTTFFTTWDKNLTAENLARIDRNRRAFHLKGINAYELKSDGLVMSVKW